MPKKPQDTVTYDLKRDRRVVYRGTTNDPARRENEHRAEGKQFERLVVTSRRMTEEGARKRESQNLQTYRRGHGGKNPLYNDQNDG